MKRLFDLVISTILLVILSPTIIICAFIIIILDGRPVFYKWHILGKDEKIIVSYKLRSMGRNSEILEKELRENSLNEMNGVYFKLKDDKRVTKFGKFIRKFSIDEFPSLYNVIKGEISLVGPRPLRVSEYNHLDNWHKERFKVKPGLTSPWVVNGKNTICDFDEIVKIDLEYIRTTSFVKDLQIILKTVPILFLGKNN